MTNIQTESMTKPDRAVNTGPLKMNECTGEMHVDSGSVHGSDFQK